MNELLTTTLLAPFAGMLVLILLDKPARTVVRGVAVGTALATAVCAMSLAFGYDRHAGGVQGAVILNWMPEIGLALSVGLDGASLPLFVVSSVVGLAALLVADIREREREFHILALAILGASLAAFASRNLFYFYFFCEMTTIPKYFLTAAWGRLPEGKYRTTPTFAAMQVTLYIAAGAMAALLGLSLLYIARGTVDLDALQARLLVSSVHTGTQFWIYGAFLLGFGIWTSMWPFHTWSPLTYAAAPAPASMLFAGIIKNFGAYGLLRVGLMCLPAGARAWATPLAIVGIINILYGGWAAMRQKDWAFIISYSSISHVGYLLLAIAAGGALGLNAAVLFMVAHSLVVALLFAVMSLLEKHAGSRHVPDLGGLARAMPFVAVAMAVAVIAASGLPGFANFIAEIMVFVAAWKQGSPLFLAGAAAAVWGIVITATYFFRALRSTFYGAPRDIPVAARPSLAAMVAIALLVAASVTLGVWPRFVTDGLKGGGEKVKVIDPLALLSDGGAR